MSTTEQRQQHIATLREFPAQLEAALTGLSEEQLDAHPSPDEWSVRQIVHHLADAHMNSIVRLRVVLTGDEQALPSYNSDAWALLPDGEAAPVETSLSILRGLHARWVILFEHVAANDLWHKSALITTGRTITADDLLRIYAGHCTNHLAQIQQVLAAS